MAWAAPEVLKRRTQVRKAADAISSEHTKVPNVTKAGSIMTAIVGAPARFRCVCEITDRRPSRHERRLRDATHNCSHCWG